MQAKTIKGKSTEEVQKTLQEATADALIMFSCVSRYLSFGMVMKEEIEQVQQIWKAHMAGFFTYVNLENRCPPCKPETPVKMSIIIIAAA